MKVIPLSQCPLARELQLTTHASIAMGGLQKYPVCVQGVKQCHCFSCTLASSQYLAQAGIHTPTSYADSNQNSHYHLNNVQAISFNLILTRNKFTEEDNFYHSNFSFYRNLGTIHHSINHGVLLLLCDHKKMHSKQYSFKFICFSFSFFIQNITIISIIGFIDFISRNISKSTLLS